MRKAVPLSCPRHQEGAGNYRSKTVDFFTSKVFRVFLVVVCFSSPTCPTRSFSQSVSCVPSYTLSSPTFNGVTHGMSIKHISLPPVTPGTCSGTGFLEHTNTHLKHHKTIKVYFRIFKELKSNRHLQQD